MSAKSKKSRFVGVRMTPEQEDLLTRLRENYGYKTHSEVLLGGLDSLAGHSPRIAGAAPFENEEVMRKVVTTLSKVDEIIDRHNKDESHLIQILLEVQREYNWLPKEALLWISRRLGITMNQIYQIATFYKAFSLIPRGRHLVRICSGTACHVRGAKTLLDRASQVLSIRPGETTKDQRFTMETVNCLGCCAIAPAIVVDEETFCNPSIADLEKAFAGRE